MTLLILSVLLFFGKLGSEFILSVASRASPYIPPTVIMADHRTLPRFEEVARLTTGFEAPVAHALKEIPRYAWLKLSKIVGLDGFI
ncbi:uncharacterized protein GLRG_04490 [Colletotrichum graminicola M1.001]|uniref:Uncharacterized protein n=1 Tax=Colletotrichum graminicola (strain M1.001 / M2 / FGSC 10212) TaxID=645133 RepID=E3QEP0_COLGM|nr:uncharacterized protein GLRG_04490 [Colletotrichum graminicola M1.001]EFQ29346.1 hypothetical protein GLRG_04490 [Colletotrichum graminicola M1.001]